MVKKKKLTVEQIKAGFSDKKLWKKALTHRSWINESENARESNERLEFLGDAVLEFVVSEDLFRKFPNKEEGFLTALRANIVNTHNLAAFAKRAGVGEALLLSKGEKQGGGAENPSLLADTVEAIIGAIFIDRGFGAAEEFIKNNLLRDLEEKLKEPLKDPKSRLQEMVQAKGFSTPKYKVISESGPDHNKKFVVEAVVDGKTLGRGEGKSKNQAEQAAAEKSLAKEGKER